ncbi:hypoxia-inducible factor 1-alpha inhibitor-like [Cimex lectularius]|uniref:JmjC domain-containing protein n=1 Tax=Cimex lectularius TaxID=79782 RepID=A0A8I6RL91_CIMLE|nr:hypoxia-inducible factor 1-alpha inhibitor-like [Cimex lectularius]
MDAVPDRWDESQLRSYDIPLTTIPKYDVQDPRVEELISQHKPVVIMNSGLVASAMKWDINYLANHMSNTSCTVIISKNHKFKYYDVRTVLPSVKAKFTPPTRQMTMKVADFAKRLKEWKKGDERFYLQQILNNTVGPGIVHDFLKFRWDWIRGIQKKMRWGELTSNLLLIGMEGNVTPCHYDEQENIFAQVRGFKRFILFPPEQFACFYPHPVYHPHDRQSQVDFDSPDLEKFPKFAEVRGEEAIVGPGDILYIPIYWWHHVESLMNGGYTVSVNFWCKAGPIGEIIYPLRGDQKVTIMRNIEKTLVEALKDPEDVGPLLRAIVLGRYTEESEEI